MPILNSKFECIMKLLKQFLPFKFIFCNRDFKWRKFLTAKPIWTLTCSHFLQPGQTLILRINHEWPLKCSCRQNTIVDGNLIAWKALDVPASDLEFVRCCPHERILLKNRNLVFDTLINKRLKHPLSIESWKRTLVVYLARSKIHVSDEKRYIVLKNLDLFYPPNSFIFE